ncbi:MAG: hypothetical protein F9K44_12335 [Hyphomicrobiaceae bacterium]|nr:MAG: hypothetical protein F9K44_12335 [Hyphomicrobiaceae bacterium]
MTSMLDWRPAELTRAIQSARKRWISTMGSKLFVVALSLATLAAYYSATTEASHEHVLQLSPAFSVTTIPFDPRRLSLSDFADNEGD